jgi:hypothetical protein
MKTLAPLGAAVLLRSLAAPRSAPSGPPTRPTERRRVALARFTAPPGLAGECAPRY